MDAVGTVVGLAGFLLQVVELSRKIANEVKPKPQLLANLVGDLTNLHAVLKQIQEEVIEANNEKNENVQDNDALRVLCKGCETHIFQLHDNLVLLQGLFSKSLPQRLLARSKFKSIMEELQSARESLAAFKLTMTIALSLRTAKQTQRAITLEDLKTLQMQISKLTLLSKDVDDIKSKTPMLQYVNLGHKFIKEEEESQSTGTASLATSMSLLSATMNPSSATTSDISLASEDTENVRLFGSYEDWLASFAPDEGKGDSGEEEESRGENPVFDKDEVSVNQPLNWIAVEKTAKVKIFINNLRRVGNLAITKAKQTATEVIELQLNESFHELITILEKKGHTGICGFQAGDLLLPPLADIREPLYITVTDGASDYCATWPRINENEPLDIFYDNLIRSEFGGVDSLRVSLDVVRSEIRIEDNLLRLSGKVILNRTLRVPEDGTVYGLPALFPPFPMVPVERVKEKVPSPVAAKGGVLIPMYPREALSLGFSALKEYEGSALQDEYDQLEFQCSQIAIRISCGGISATNLSDINNQAGLTEQNFVVLPEQERLDGFLSAPKEGRGVVRQFVAMASGLGYSAEFQITGEEAINGVQLLIATPTIAEGSFYTLEDDKIKTTSMTPLQLGMNVGDKLKVSGDELVTQLRRKYAGFDNRRFVFPTDEKFTQFPGIDTRKESSISQSNEWLRPVPLFQALSPLWDASKGCELLCATLSATYSMSLKLEHVGHSVAPDIEGKTPVEARVWTLTPFLPLQLWRDMIPLEFDGWSLPRPESQCDNPRILADLYQHGQIIRLVVPCIPVVDKMPWHRMIQTEPRIRDAKAATVSHWEMGIAAGGLLYQDVSLQRNRKVRWNWKRARHLNVQILNAVAFKSYTGITPADSPISFSEYVSHGIPFYQPQPQPQNRLAARSKPLALQSTSIIDQQKGIQSATQNTDASAAPEGSYSWKKAEHLTSLEEAAEQNQTNLAADILRSNTQGSESKLAATCIAIICQNPDMLQVLLQWSIENEPQPSQMLHAAVTTASASGATWALDMLFDRWGCAQYRHEFTIAIREATKNGNTLVIAQLMKACLPTNGAVHSAAENGAVDILKLFHDAGVNMDEVFGPKSYRPIHCAAISGQRGSVEFLLGCGVALSAPKHPNSPFDTPLVMAVKSGHLDVAKMFYQHSESVPFWDGMACRAGLLHELGLLETYLRAGVNPDAKDEHGRGILHLMQSFPSVALNHKFGLLGHAFRFQTRDVTPDTLELLRRYGGNLMLESACSVFGRRTTISIFHWYIRFSNGPMVETLTGLGCDYHARLPNGLSSLHISPLNSASSIVEAGLDPNDRGSDQDIVPLQCAIYKGAVGAIHVLFQLGAVVDLGTVKELLVLGYYWSMEPSEMLNILPPFLAYLKNHKDEAQVAVGVDDATVASRLVDTVCLVASDYNQLQDTILNLYREVECIAHVDLAARAILVHHAVEASWTGFQSALRESVVGEEEAVQLDRLLRKLNSIVPGMAPKDVTRLVFMDETGNKATMKRRPAVIDDIAGAPDCGPPSDQSDWTL
ncbi:hypothetical protein NLG97_g2028 [Lecanicillium saksenae]|uniref:Uncharacterized protein n=1 Tax=Lecanicillium saksenae TaxID=468837 RepID=A0ACC1R248_9HYPO|nr:hypothetical protein NLG97_g2028 [Lecanicillium saksenae]